MTKQKKEQPVSLKIETFLLIKDIAKREGRTLRSVVERALKMYDSSNK